MYTACCVRTIGTETDKLRNHHKQHAPEQDLVVIPGGFSEIWTLWHIGCISGNDRTWNRWVTMCTSTSVCRACIPRGRVVEVPQYNMLSFSPLPVYMPRGSELCRYLLPIVSTWQRHLLANTMHSTNVVWMLGQRHRFWININPELVLTSCCFLE